MQIINLCVAYPSGNTTAVIFEDLSSSDLKELNLSIMKAWKIKFPHLHEIEQCCFIKSPINPKAIARIEMFGGKFCGNGARSALFLIARGRDCRGFVEVSGTSRLLEFIISSNRVTLELPFLNARHVEEGILIYFEGIVHLVVIDKKIITRDLLIRLLNENKYQLKDYPAVGVIFFDQKTSLATYSVWINGVDTIFDETACGSGTGAIGIALSLNNNCDIDQEILQLSNKTIRTIVSFDKKSNKIEKNFIQGNVDQIYKGKLFI